MYQLSVYLHIVGAMVWVGGMLFLGLVIVPVARQLPAGERAALLENLGRRCRAVGWACIALLLATGVVNTGFRGVTWESLLSGRILEGWFGQVLAAKLAVVGLMLVLSGVHDFAVGPASVRALKRSEPAAVDAAAELRRRASWMGRATIVLALLVVALAVMLVRGIPR